MVPISCHWFHKAASIQTCVETCIKNTKDPKSYATFHLDRFEDMSKKSIHIKTY